jgi:hypothetical protein
MRHRYYSIQGLLKYPLFRQKRKRPGKARLTGRPRKAAQQPQIRFAFQPLDQLAGLFYPKISLGKKTAYKRRILISYAPFALKLFGRLI